MSTLPQKLLKIEDLVLHFKTRSGTVQAVDGVDFELDTNRAVVILGESGCGKSSLAKAILRLLPRNVQSYGGRVFLQGTDVMTFDEEQFRQNVRWAKISLVPQAAMNSLNPVIKVSDQVAEPAMVHLGIRKDEALKLARRMFQHVGVPEDFLDRYPFELSGGMRQRVALAMALVTSPSLIVLDEPTSALDLLTQANIMNVLKRIKQELGTSFILITHNIATSSELADEVAIMYAGQIVEVGHAKDFFLAPLDPYAQNAEAFKEVPPGEPPSLVNPPAGCRFHPRCPHFMAGLCDVKFPPDFEPEPEHFVACWLYQ